MLRQERTREQGCEGRKKQNNPTAHKFYPAQRKEICMSALAGEKDDTDTKSKALPPVE